MKETAYRILYKPLLVSSAGQVLPGDEIDAAQFLIDPLKYSTEGLSEAAHYSNPTLLAKSIAAVKDPEGFMEPLFNPRSEEKPAYKDAIHAKSGSPAFEEELTRYLQQVRSDTERHPEKLFPAIEASRDQAKKQDARLNRDMAYTPPEQMPDLMGMKADTGYPGDHEYATDAQRSVVTVRGLIKKMPDYLRDNIEQEPVTIAIMRTLPRYDAGRPHGASQADSNLIAINGGSTELSKADLILREEVVHYLDRKTGFSDRPDFKAAVDSMFSDGQRLKQVVEAIRDIHGENKVGLAHYAQDQRYPEVLAEYVHFKEDLREMMPSWQRFLPGAKKHMRQELAGLFGPEIRKLSDQFEDELRLRAKSGRQGEITH